jgi:hypothetical protein
MQVFKERPPIDILINFLNLLNQNKQQSTEVILINSCAYKTALSQGVLLEFLNKLVCYYYNKKKYFVTREINYKRLITILRQLCNTHGIIYNSHMLYHKSSYDICYTFYLPN